LEIKIEEDRIYDKRNGERIYLSDFVNQNFENYNTNFYQGLSKVTDFSIGSEAYNQLLAQSNIQMDEFILQDILMSNYTMVTASGEFLDDFGYRDLVHRIPASFSNNIVVFTLPSVRNVPSIIPAGTDIGTSDGVIFNVDEDLIIPSGSLSGSVSVTCEEEGTIGNVNIGEINIILTELGFPCTVTNEVNFVNGVDEEDDDTYRERIRYTAEHYPAFSYDWFEMKARTIVRDAKYELLPESNNAVLTFINNSDNTAETLLTNLFNEGQNRCGFLHLSFTPASEVQVFNQPNAIINVYIDDLSSWNIISEDIRNKLINYTNNLRIGEVFEINMVKFLCESVSGVTGVIISNMTDVDLTVSQYSFTDGTDINLVNGGIN